MSHECRRPPASPRVYGAGPRTWLAITLAIVAAGCDDSVPTIPTPDNVPPATSTLAQGVTTMTSIELTWTAPGDDGRTGTAAAYDIRYATAPITPSTWAAATPTDGEPTPGVPGAAESFTGTGLAVGTPYHVSLRTRDEANNWSALSNVLAAATAPAPDITPPAAVTDLAVTSATTVSLTLTWSAPGADGAAGTAAAYDLRRSTEPITESNWDAAIAVDAEPVPSAAGATESGSR